MSGKILKGDEFHRYVHEIGRKFLDHSTGLDLAPLQEAYNYLFGEVERLQAENERLRGAGTPFENALVRFTEAMHAKFHAKDALNGARSIVRLTDEQAASMQGIFEHFIAASMQGLFEHFIDDVRELFESPLDRTEMVDVANMSFAMWWQQEGRETP